MQTCLSSSAGLECPQLWQHMFGSWRLLELALQPTVMQPGTTLSPNLALALQLTPCPICPALVQ